jgi:predicted nucleic acid-binding protein
MRHRDRKPVAFETRGLTISLTTRIRFFDTNILVYAFLDIEKRQRAVTLARDHCFAFYDALIVAAALETGCNTLHSEDLQDGRALAGLTIVNPFTADAA